MKLPSFNNYLFHKNLTHAINQPTTYHSIKAKMVVIWSFKYLTSFFMLFSDLGVILPQVVTAGTVTRRAVEPTWLTASNPLVNNWK